MSQKVAPNGWRAIIRIGTVSRTAPWLAVFARAGREAGGTRSVAAEAARRLEVGEFTEIEVDNGLQGLPGGGVAQRFR